MNRGFLIANRRDWLKMSIFELATLAAFNSQRFARGKSASYVVNSTTTISDLTIVPAETIRDIQDETGLIMSERLQDWLILVSDLEGTEPKESHQISVGSEIFELTKTEDSKAFSFHNPPSNTIYRIHTILKSGESG